MKRHPKIPSGIKKLKQENARLRKLEKTEQEFLRVTSHELRTPVDVIRGNLDMVLKGDAGQVNPQVREYIKDALLESDRLAKLISDTLDISRIESGRLKLDIKKTDIVELTGKLVADLRVLADKKKIRLIFLPPEKDFPAVLADKDKVIQVLDNIIGNAVKFTTQGSVEVSLRKDAEFAVVSVKDTGSGISKRDQPKLFKKFPQIYSEGAEKGNGLGLYVSSRFVAKMGGKIWAESEGLGKGSVFSFTLPLYE